MMFNRTLLRKCLRHYVHERGAWLRFVLNSKFYNSWGEWSNEPLGSKRVGLWKNIWRGWRMFSSHTRFEVGGGSEIRFWHDLWCGDKAFKEAFSDLYSIGCVKDDSFKGSFGAF